MSGDPDHPPAASRAHATATDPRAIPSRAALYRSVIQAMAEGVVVHGRDGRILEANPSAERILGLSFDQMTGKLPIDPSWRLVLPDGSPLTPEHIPSEITRKTRRPCRNHQFGVHRPSGELVWLSVSADLVPEEVEPSDGGDPMVVATFVDLTRDRAMAEGLRRAGRREALGEMAAGLAHNFNNLLAAILPNLELALSTRLAREDAIVAIEDALSATRSAADLVRQLFNFTRAADEPLARHPVELTTVVRDATRFCRRTFDSKIAIVETFSRPPVYVLGEATNLQQIVMNLCLNARDALAKRESPELRIELRAVGGGDERGQREAVLVVRDNGTGMPPEVMSRLGEPFFTTKSPGRGTGLGLATVYGIVRDAGGTIRCESTVGGGTRFEVRLPMVEVADLAANQATRVHPRTMRGLVMIVDDQDLVRTALRRQLQVAGLEAVEASSGAEAIRYLESEAPKPRLMLLDLSMPGMSGDEVLAVVVERWPTVPVIIVSGHRDPSSALVGAFAILKKPLDGATLLAAVEAALATTTA